MLDIEKKQSYSQEIWDMFGVLASPLSWDELLQPGRVVLLVQSYPQTAFFLEDNQALESLKKGKAAIAFPRVLSGGSRGNPEIALTTFLRGFNLSLREPFVNMIRSGQGEQKSVKGYQIRRGGSADKYPCPYRV